MENFKCYEIHRANMPQYGCTVQCPDCERKELLIKSDAPFDKEKFEEEAMMEVPMPISKGKDPIIEAAEKWVFETNGHKWSNNNDEAGDNYSSFKAGAEWMQQQYRSTYAELYSIMEDCNKPRKTVFTEDQMYLFAGYCMGKKLIDPSKDVADIMKEWKEEMNINQKL